MTGDLEHVPADRPTATDVAGGAVAISGAAAWELAQKIARTEFVPQALRGKPESVLAAILFGRELGIGPMQSLQAIHVIDGRPGASPELMRALVARAGHRIDVVESDREHVTLAGERYDTGATASVTWSIADAEQAGLLQLRDGRPFARSSNGRPLPWETYTRAMLLARATAELCRALFADVISGLSYTVEELQSISAPVEAAAPVDWHGLGWTDQTEHDHERDRIRTALAALAGAVRDELLAKWSEMGLAWPLSRDQLAEWEQVAAAIINQETAGEPTDVEPDGEEALEADAPSADEPPAYPRTGPNMRVPAALLGAVREAAARVELSDPETCEYLATMFGRPVAQLEDLTVAQARAAIETLGAIEAPAEAST
jgi:hypothetical protein